MLKEFIESKHYKFAESAKDWKDAIRMSCESLEADGTVEANYKDATLFFTLASCNPEQHLDNMSRLAEMLSNEELIEDRKKVKGPEDLLKLQEKYL